MPIYEYDCKKCGVVDIMQKISEGTKRKCPECGTLGLRRLVSAPAFQLKGDGWYVTDFRDKDKKKDKAADESTSESSSTKPTSDGDSKPTSDGDSKSSSKTDSKSSSKSESKSDSKSSTTKKAAND